MTIFLIVANIICGALLGGAGISSQEYGPMIVGGLLAWVNFASAIYIHGVAS